MESELTIAMVFPDQGSQSQGMQADLAAKYSLVQGTCAEALACLVRRISRATPVATIDSLTGLRNALRAEELS